MINISKLENLKKEWQAIMSCMGCGDCGYAIRPAVGRYLTCPVKESKADEGFEIYFSRGRMNVLIVLKYVMKLIMRILFLTLQNGLTMLRCGKP